MNMEQSVPKLRHIKFRRRGITQKKAYNYLIILMILFLYYLYISDINTAGCGQTELSHYICYQHVYTKDDNFVKRRFLKYCKR
jgi:hypothetical protein